MVTIPPRPTDCQSDPTQAAPRGRAEAVMTMTCKICDESIRTGRVQALIAFDREHKALHQ